MSESKEIEKDSENAIADMVEVINDYSKTPNAVIFETSFKYARYYLFLVALGVLTKSLFLYSFSNGYSLRLIALVPALVSLFYAFFLFLLWLGSAFELSGRMLLEAKNMTYFNKRYGLSFLNGFILNMIIFPITLIATLFIIITLKVPLF